MVPEVERFLDAKLTSARFSKPTMLYFDRIFATIAFAKAPLEKAAPLQFGQDIGPRTSGMAVHDHAKLAVAECQGSAGAVVYRAPAAPPGAGTMFAAEARGNLYRIHWTGSLVDWRAARSIQSSRSQRR